MTAMQQIGNGSREGRHSKSNRLYIRSPDVKEILRRYIDSGVLLDRTS